MPKAGAALHPIMDFDLILKQLFTNNTNEGSICTYTVIYLEWCKSAAVDFKISSDLLNSGC